MKINRAYTFWMLRALGLLIFAWTIHAMAGTHSPDWVTTAAFIMLDFTLTTYGVIYLPGAASNLKRHLQARRPAEYSRR